MWKGLILESASDFCKQMRLIFAKWWKLFEPSRVCYHLEIWRRIFLEKQSDLWIEKKKTIGKMRRWCSCNDETRLSKSVKTIAPQPLKLTKWSHLTVKNGAIAPFQRGIRLAWQRVAMKTAKMRYFFETPVDRFWSLNVTIL